MSVKPEQTSKHNYHFRALNAEEQSNPVTPSMWDISIPSAWAEASMNMEQAIALAIAEQVANLEQQS